ncbi:MAG: penicillin-insensitive murein endopeptidase [Myxococcota bacterium]
MSGASDPSDSGELNARPDPDDDIDAVDEVRAALAAEDDDLLEPDVFSDDDEPPAAPRTRRRRLAPTLLVLGGSAWAAVMIMRCSPGAPPADGLTVPPAAEEAPVDGAPQPASDAPAQPDRSPEPQSDAAPDGGGDPEPEPEPAEDPEPEDWAKDVELPQVVTYTVRHGGSIKNVANLFKIFHHEIQALNPGVPLDKELAPGTAVVVFRQQPGEVSESVGVASNGTLEGGVPMLQGPGRVLKMIPWKGWATADTVATLDRVLRRWAADEAHDQPVLVGNMSSRHGGRLEPHSTHQSGRDVDLGYMQKLPKGEELNWREMSSANLDAEATWALLKLLRATGKLEVVFIDSKVQKLLYEWARDEGGMSKSTLRRWMEYPRTPPARGAIIQHVPGHVDHLHARFVCRPHEKRCKSRKR